MVLGELLETLKDNQELDIYFNNSDSLYDMDYHYYGKTRYITKAFDLSFYYSEVTQIDYYMPNKGDLVMKICCV